MSVNRIKRVAFIDHALREAFLNLKSGRFEEKQLAEHIQRAIDDLKENPFTGITIPKRLWPKE